MESGIARIIHGIGRIATAPGPTPVSFAPPSFPSIVDGEPVQFIRAASNPAWAVYVVPAPMVERLVSMATPAAGLTRDAHTLVRTRAVQFVHEIHAAPTEAMKRQHLKFARDTMKSVSAATTPTGRIGVRAVASILK
jgi:hypothetical protein